MFTSITLDVLLECFGFVLFLLAMGLYFTGSLCKTIHVGTTPERAPTPSLKQLKGDE